MENQNETTAPKRQKADINLKIDLPNVDKPFFERLSTQNNMISQIKKAGAKLGESDQMNVSVNNKTIQVLKSETLSPNLKEIIQDKLNTRDINKGTEQGNQDTSQSNAVKSNAPMTESKNLDYLKDQIKYLGFGEDEKVHRTLADKLKGNEKAFSISIDSDKASFQNKVSFDLHFNKANDTSTTFLNKFDARLTNEKRNVDIQHTFSVKNNGFTAKQAINLLEGRAVKTEITNPNTKEKEMAYVKLKLNEEKNDSGNFKLQVYNKNYGVDASKIVDKSNLLFKDEKHKDITIKSLEKGNIVAVKFKHDNNEIEGKAVLNPQYKTINLYDKNMKRVNTNAPVLDKSESEDIKHEVKAQQHHARKM